MNITIPLNIFERKFLVFLSERGGSQDMRPSVFKEDNLRALDTLKEKGAIEIVPIIGNQVNTYRLTSIGTNLVDLIKANPND